MFHDLNPLLSKGFLLRQISEFDSDSRGNREPQKTFEQEHDTVRETLLKRSTDKGNVLRDFPGQSSEGLIPGRGIEILQATQHSQKEKKKKQL